MVSRILFVSNLYPPAIEGGAELVASREARGFLARGLDVAVLAGIYAEGDRQPGSIDVDEIGGVLVYRVPFRPSDQNENFYRSSTAGHLRALITAHRAELVHFHNVMGLGANLIPAAKQAGVKVVVTLHDHWGFCFKNTVIRNDGRICVNSQECALCEAWVQAESGCAVPMRLRRDYVAWCLEQADLLISPSAYLADAYRAAGIAARIERISNGVDLAAVPAQPKRPTAQVRFACLAYIGAHKGIPVLLDAAEQLACDNTIAGRWSLIIAGPGPLAGKLQADIAAGRFGGAVRYSGQLPHCEAIKLMNASDVVVLPSVWPENEPVTLVEAIASGTAQLASRIGGILDLVEEGASGLLAEPGDSCDLADKMRRYILDPRLAAQHGTWNKERRRDFDERRTLDRLQRLYSEETSSVQSTRSVVLCACNRTPREISLLIDRFHSIEQGRFQMRFIWHEWAEARVWHQAALLWLWDATPPLSTLRRALGQGLPILAPAGSTAQQLKYSGATVIGYATYLEAASAIAALAELPDCHRPDNQTAPDLARLIATIAPRESFHLPIGASI